MICKEINYTSIFCFAGALKKRKKKFLILITKINLTLLEITFTKIT